MTQFDNTQAMREGWCISYTDGCGQHGEDYELQKLDEAEVFGSDVEAQKFVRSKAEHSPYHYAALAYLQEHAPKEYKSIMALVA